MQPQQRPPAPPQQYGQPMRPGPHPGWRPPPPPPPRRRNPALIGLAVLAAAVVVLIGLVFALGDDTKPKPVAEPSASSSTPSSATETKAVPMDEVPKPDAQQAQQLRAALGQIEPGLDHERSIGRARNSCWDLLNGMNRDKVVGRTQYRFNGGSADVDILDAEKILTVIEGTFCRR